MSKCDYLNIEDTGLSIERTNSYVIAHLNIRGLSKKVDELIDLLKMMDEQNMLPEVILLCETFLTEKNYDKFHIDGYVMINEYRKIKQRGGVSILIKTGINYIERPDLKIFEEGKFESIFLEILQKNRPNTIIGEQMKLNLLKIMKA